MQTQIRVYTLGRLAIERDGQVLENFLSAKTALLFVYLAMHPGEHTREKLAFLLWSETDDEQSLKNLRTVLSSLRQQLDDVLEISRKSLAVREDVSIWVDATIFEQACADGFALPGSLDPIKQMEELAAIYQGDFLAGVRIRDAADLDDWASEQRHRLSQLYRQLLSEIAARSIQQGTYGVGLTYAWKLVALDPLGDDSRRQLMTLLAYSNRVNDALTQYEQFATLLEDELGAAPEEETTRLYERIKAGAVRAPQPAARKALGAPDMLFVEPADDIEFAQRMLNSPQCRLLTLYGISGVGKTALAQQLAFHRQYRYRDGAYFLTLSQAQSASSLPALLARALGIDFASTADDEAVQEMVIDYLQGREALLVLDNYEHLLPDTTFVERLLDEVAGLQLIVASQNPLNLYREWLLPLKGLRVPELTSRDPESYEAVRLFELTAQRINPRYNVADELSGVIRICQLVDGLPLGIVLAAGWTQVLPVRKIVEYLIEGLEFNLSYQRTLPERHQSIETVLEYTWNTLDAIEQRTLIALSVFQGPFDLDAFTGLCDAGIDTLTSLIQKSLVLKFGEAYRIHQLVGRYARRKLFFSPEREAMSRSYLDYYRQRMKQLQRRRIPLHEYTLAIERDYSSLWNYDWMPTWYQPIYILSLSRYLIAYWEIHQGTEIRQAGEVFDQLVRDRGLQLESAWRALLHLQVARLRLQARQVADADHHLRLALQHACATETWHDHGLLFDLYGAINDLGLEASAGEESILRTAYRALARLYLDTQDYEAADELFVHHLEGIDEAVDRVVILAARGAIAAECQAPAAAHGLFEEALQAIPAPDHPLLALVLAGGLARLAGNLGLEDDLCRYVALGITLAVQGNYKPALANLLDLCAEVIGDGAGGNGRCDVVAAIQALSPEVLADRQVAAFLAGQAGTGRD